jgi:hypothetical protein
LILFDVLLGVEILPAAFRFLAESIAGGSELAAKCTRYCRVFHSDGACACACTTYIAPIGFAERASGATNMYCDFAEGDYRMNAAGNIEQRVFETVLYSVLRILSV